MPFLSRGGGCSTLKEKNSRKPYQTVSRDGLFHIRYFENGPLEPGCVKDSSIYKKVLATAPKIYMRPDIMALGPDSYECREKLTVIGNDL